MCFLFVFVFEDTSDNRSMTDELQLRRGERLEVENGPTSRKSKQYESSTSEVNQLTSTSAEDLYVHDSVSEQQPSTSQQRSVQYESGNMLSSGEVNAKQHGNNEPNVGGCPCLFVSQF